MDPNVQLDSNNIANVSRTDRVDPYVRRTRFQRSTSVPKLEEESDELEQLPGIMDAPDDQKVDLLAAKIKQCQKVFNFSNSSQLKSKEIKRLALSDIIDYIMANDEEAFPEIMYQEVFLMVSYNVFREIHPVETEDFDVEEDEPILEICWPHFALIYELLLRFLDSPRFVTATAKKYLNRMFIYNLLNLFNSEDPRERDYLKTIIHRIYGKFLCYRQFIRKEINNIFLSYVFEDITCKGISELLEILGSVINGFAVPLKKEHKLFLEKVLMPLYSSRNLSTFHAQLGYCIIQFVHKEPALGEMVINRILRYWPKTSSNKEIVYLNELYDITRCIHVDKLRKVIIPLFRQVCLSANSQHYQVAEAAIRFLRDEQNMLIIERFSKQLHPIMLPILSDIADRHWHNTIRALVRIVTRQISNSNSTSDESKEIVIDSKNTCKNEEHEEITQQMENMSISNN